MGETDERARRLVKWGRDRGRKEALNRVLDAARRTIQAAEYAEIGPEPMTRIMYIDDLDTLAFALASYDEEADDE